MCLQTLQRGRSTCLDGTASATHKTCLCYVLCRAISRRFGSWHLGFLVASCLSVRSRVIFVRPSHPLASLAVCRKDLPTKIDQNHTMAQYGKTCWKPFVHTFRLLVTVVRSCCTKYYHDESVNIRIGFRNGQSGSRLYVQCQ
jgi:hypothetical protein